MTSRKVPRDSCCVDRDPQQLRWHRLILEAPNICFLNSFGELVRFGALRANDRQALYPEVLDLCLMKKGNHIFCLHLGFTKMSRFSGGSVSLAFSPSVE